MVPDDAEVALPPPSGGPPIPDWLSLALELMEEMLRRLREELDNTRERFLLQRKKFEKKINSNKLTRDRRWLWKIASCCQWSAGPSKSNDKQNKNFRKFNPTTNSRRWMNFLKLGVCQSIKESFEKGVFFVEILRF